MMRSDVWFLVAMIAGLGWIGYLGTAAADIPVLLYATAVVVVSGLTLWLDAKGLFTGRLVYAINKDESVGSRHLLLFECWMLRSQIMLVIGITVVVMWAGV